MAPDLAAAARAMLAATAAGATHRSTAPAEDSESLADVRPAGPQELLSESTSRAASTLPELQRLSRAGAGSLSQVAPVTAAAATNHPAAAEERVPTPSQLPSRKRSDDAAARSRSPLPVPIAAFPAPPRPLWRSGVLRDLSGKR